ncbi:hypothetical protein [Paracoccus pacificus]|uniref:Lipase (Class 3) n=1 Tax=Paracoccus pacificus TaxID=1463598 RepID=A0ABW4R4C3_9RHOB
MSALPSGSELSRIIRRKVFYIPGYDPIPPRRYREIYRAEGAEQARISGYSLNLKPRARQDRGKSQNYGWGVATVMDGAETEAQVEVLIWSDIVQKSMGRSIVATYWQLVRTLWIYAVSSALRRMLQIRNGPVIAGLYPIVFLSLQLVLGLVLGAIAGWILWHLLGSWPLSLLAFLALAAGTLILFRRMDHRFYAYYLMHDYAFTAACGGAYPPQLEPRMAAFTARIREALAQDWDEVLVVGHSSGAHLAVSVLSDLLRADPPDAAQAPLALLTLGQAVPMASFLPTANRLRGDLRYLSASDRLTWVDVSAPGDPCSFGLCDPVAVTGVAPTGQRWPLVISAAFTRTLSPEKQRQLRHRWFRLHFQYLHAFDRPGDYDYFAISAGPRTLADRYRGRPHSPGRITRAVNRWTAT